MLSALAEIVSNVVGLQRDSNITAAVLGAVIPPLLRSSKPPESPQKRAAGRPRAAAVEAAECPAQAEIQAACPQRGPRSGARRAQSQPGCNADADRQDREGQPLHRCQRRARVRQGSAEAGAQGGT